MPNYLSLSTINKFVPLARKRGVSAVARESGGFLSAYRRAGGNPDRLSDQWAAKRDAFVARHMAQVKRGGESLWDDGLPSRRHLALIMWAYSPDASRLSKTALRESSRIVSDFDTVESLTDHARSEGATHILHVDDEIHIYFQRRDGSYEKAEVWQKDGYWHTQAPGSRVIVRRPPENAETIGTERQMRSNRIPEFNVTLTDAEATTILDALEVRLDGLDENDPDDQDEEQNVRDAISKIRKAHRRWRP